MLKRDPEKVAARAEKAEERTEKQEVKALENLRARRGYIVAKLSMQSTMSLTKGALVEEISKLAQELYYLDAAMVSLQRDVDGH